MAAPMDQERIFLSAVSGEFKTAREKLGLTLRGLALLVREQSDFSADPRGLTLLDKLHNYIKDCGCIISLIGTRSGLGHPKPPEAARYLALLPPGIGTTWSYTQWEVFFALHYEKKIVTIQASGDWKPDTDGAPDDQQTRFVAYLQSLGTDLTVQVDHPSDVRAEVMRALWPGQPAHKPDNLPFPSIGTLFTGRDDFLTQLRTSLLRTGGGASAIVSSVCGMGGIGKTRTAIEYAHRHHDAYTALLFVRAPNERTLTDELAALTGVLRLPEADATDTIQKRDAALHWLAGHHGWLLILDNVDTPDAVRSADEIVRKLRGGHVLLTSRLDDAFRHGIEPLELGLLTLDDAVAYLLKVTATRRQTNPDDAAQARVLAEALDRLTLALVHAGAYIAERRISFARYLTEWNLRRDAVLDWAKPEKTGYPLSLAQTWLTAMDQLTEPGKALLERLSFLANDPVPAVLLDVPLSDGKAPQGLDPLLDLARYSLITRDAAAEAFSVHRIVRDQTDRHLAANPAKHRARLSDALGWINAAFVGEGGDVRTWLYLGPLAPHAERVAWAADNAGIWHPTSGLMNRLAMLFQAKAQHLRAESLFRRALEIDETSYGPDHPNVAIGLNNLGGLLLATNRWQAAEPMLRRALAIAEGHHERLHPSIARYLSNLAQLLQETGRIAEAEPLIRQALAIDEVAYGPDHQNVAIRLSNLANLLQSTLRFSEAEALIRRALLIDEAIYGFNHPTVAIRLNNLAQLLQDTNRLAEAEPLMRRAMAIDEVWYSFDHPNIARDINNLATLLQATNRLGEAEPLLLRALEISQTNLGPDHPTVATRLNNLATLFFNTDRLAEAEPLMRRALMIDERSYGPAHPNVAIRLNNLAYLLRASGNISEAEVLMRRALVINEASHGAKHPNVVIQMNELADLLEENNQIEEAARLLGRAEGVEANGTDPSRQKEGRSETTIYGAAVGSIFGLGTRQRPATYRFGIREGKIDMLPGPEDIIADDVAKDIYEELVAKAHALCERLVNTNLQQGIRSSIERLLTCLGSDIGEVRAGRLLSISRSINAHRDEFNTERTRGELFPDTVIMMNDLSESLRDLLSVFPIVREIEAERLALEITADPGKIAAISRETAAIRQAASESDAVSVGAIDALTTNDAEIEAARDITLKADLWADKLLIVRNFTSAAIRGAARSGRSSTQNIQSALETAGNEIRALGGESWRAAKSNLPKGIGDAARIVPILALVALTAQIAGPVITIGALVTGFGPILRAINQLRIGDKRAEASVPRQAEGSDHGLYRNCRAHIEQSGFSIVAIAANAGIHQSAVKRTRACRYPVASDTVHKIINALNSLYYSAHPPPINFDSEYDQTTEF
jgi:tetratricopeptide (TPR) repeat protein